MSGRDIGSKYGLQVVEESQELNKKQEDERLKQFHHRKACNRCADRIYQLLIQEEKSFNLTSRNVETLNVEFDRDTSKIVVSRSSGGQLTLNFHPDALFLIGASEWSGVRHDYSFDSIFAESGCRFVLQPKADQGNYKMDFKEEDLLGMIFRILFPSKNSQ